MRYLGIGELARTARVRASALRYREERGLLTAPGEACQPINTLLRTSR
ncbi:hypothetical protein [Kitasatospora sp. NPDC057541]